MSRTYPGSVYNAFEQEVDMTGKPLSIERKQSAVGISADDLIEIFGAARPNHIKLDVDSTEVAIPARGGAAAAIGVPAFARDRERDRGHTAKSCYSVAALDRRLPCLPPWPRRRTFDGHCDLSPLSATGGTILRESSLRRLPHYFFSIPTA